MLIIRNNEKKLQYLLIQWLVIQKEMQLSGSGSKVKNTLVWRTVSNLSSMVLHPAISSNLHYNYHMTVNCKQKTLHQDHHHHSLCK
jgi:hypothetical protein